MHPNRVPLFQNGDKVLVKNRASGSLEPRFVGPYVFVDYKDTDGYASILEDENGK